MAIGASIGIAGTSQKTSASQSNETPLSATTQLQLRIDELKSLIDQWYEAKLGGDRNQRDRFESAIIELVRVDMEETRQLVRKIARQAALPPDADKPGDTLVQQAFSQAHAYLNIKERLSQSFIRVEAFSNKYRLINDYVDLLRKQLDMPKTERAQDLADGAAPDAPRR
jgi:cobalamin biosynthesis Mg chelatase CobN